MLKSIKLGLLGVASRCGFSAHLLNSDWRRRRLLILCYHGVSLGNEHEWDPALYLTALQLRERLEYLRREHCQVLELGDAIRRLYDGTLPKRAVTITFDDGMYDFYERAFPILRELELPATVYLTTYYSRFKRPVFDLMSSYLLWMAKGQTLTWPDVLPVPITLSSEGRTEGDARIKEFARRNKMSGPEKDELLRSLATRLHIDYDELCRRRILQIMTPEEIETIRAGGIDIQLHTHRHRLSRQAELFDREIEQNRSCVMAAGGSPEHFCYPGGFHLPEFPDWLRKGGIKSATTCKPGIASRRANPFLLPRLVDSMLLTPAEFGGWVSGLASLLPQRSLSMDYSQLLENDFLQ